MFLKHSTLLYIYIYIYIIYTFYFPFNQRYQVIKETSTVCIINILHVFCPFLTRTRTTLNDMYSTLSGHSFSTMHILNLQKMLENIGQSLEMMHSVKVCQTIVFLMHFLYTTITLHDVAMKLSLNMHYIISKILETRPCAKMSLPW